MTVLFFRERSCCTFAIRRFPQLSALGLYNEEIFPPMRCSGSRWAALLKGDGGRDCQVLWRPRLFNPAVSYLN